MWFDPARGFGFIYRGEGQQNVFLHANQLDSCGLGRSLAPQTKVRFNIGPDPKTGKECAVDIEVVESAAA